MPAPASVIPLASTRDVEAPVRGDSQLILLRRDVQQFLIRVWKTGVHCCPVGRFDQREPAGEFFRRYIEVTAAVHHDDRVWQAPVVIVHGRQFQALAEDKGHAVVRVDASALDPLVGDVEWHGIAHVVRKAGGNSIEQRPVGHLLFNGAEP
jgi:hypothetical protein